MSGTSVLDDGRTPQALHLWVWGATCLVIITLSGLESGLRGSGIWEQWTASGEFRKPVYTETVYPRDLFRTKANTWSNLAYVVVGFYAIGYGLIDRRSQRAGETSYLKQTPAMSWLFGIACCLLGFGSGLFHASLTRWGQQIDVASMYAPLVALIAINLGRMCPRIGKSTPSWPILFVATIVVVSLLFVYKWSMSSRDVLSTLILMLSGFVIIDAISTFRIRNLSWILASIVTMCLAVVCRETDIAGRFTGPDSIFQGHALWHVLTGLSLACLYVYHRVVHESWLK